MDAKGRTYHAMQTASSTRGLRRQAAGRPMQSYSMEDGFRRDSGCLCSRCCAGEFQTPFEGTLAGVLLVFNQKGRTSAGAGEALENGTLANASALTQGLSGSFARAI